MNSRKLGIAIIGLGGAVGTTMVAGIELLKKGKIGTEGLPLANLDAHLIKDLADYKDIVFGGWDLFTNAPGPPVGDDRATAARASGNGWSRP